MTLQRLGHLPGSQAETQWHNTLAAAITRHRGTVCEGCGLDNMGHGPSSVALGHEPHPYSPTPATPDMLQRAEALTIQAYRNRATEVQA